MTYIQRGRPPKPEPPKIVIMKAWQTKEPTEPTQKIAWFYILFCLPVAIVGGGLVVIPFYVDNDIATNLLLWIIGSVSIFAVQMLIFRITNHEKP